MARLSWSKGDHAELVFLGLAYLTQYSIFQIHPFSYKFHIFFCLLLKNLIVHIYHIFIINWWTFRLVPFSWYCEQSHNEHKSTNITVVVYGLLWVYTQRCIAESNDSFIFSILQNLRTDFHSGCISLHSHQQWGSVAISWYLCKHL